MTALLNTASSSGSEMSNEASVAHLLASIDEEFENRYSFETLNRLARATTARMTQGVSPHALGAAWLDWATHLTRAPGRQIELLLRALDLSVNLALFASRRLTIDSEEPPFESAPYDRRLAAAAWKIPPFVFFEQAVYKIHLFTANELTFVLTNGGHNAGVVSEPDHSHRRYRIGVRRPDDRYVNADKWLTTARPIEGSWWPTWSSWLKARSTGDLVSTPQLGDSSRGLASICPAPGAYVHQR